MSLLAVLQLHYGRWLDWRCHRFCRINDSMVCFYLSFWISKLSRQSYPMVNLRLLQHRWILYICIADRRMFDIDPNGTLSLSYPLSIIMTLLCHAYSRFFAQNRDCSWERDNHIEYVQSGGQQVEIALWRWRASVEVVPWDVCFTRHVCTSVQKECLT